MKLLIKSFKHYLDFVEDLNGDDQDVVLFRGQSDDDSLLPSVARNNPKLDTTETEKEMLTELKRQTQLKINIQMKDDWEWLIYAQHFGMKTRLLDWSSNPLTALWFACSNEYKLKNDSYVYIFSANSEYLVKNKANESPFDQKLTRILKPALNNERIIAQAGWFTAHVYSNSTKSFVKMETNKNLKKFIFQLQIPSHIKLEILKKLSVFGVNSQSLFPDVVGTCIHINWMYSNKLS